MCPGNFLEDFRQKSVEARAPAGCQMGLRGFVSMIQSILLRGVRLVLEVSQSRLDVPNKPNTSFASRAKSSLTTFESLDA